MLFNGVQTDHVIAYDYHHFKPDGYIANKSGINWEALQKHQMFHHIKIMIYLTQTYKAIWITINQTWFYRHIWLKFVACQKLAYIIDNW